MAEEEDYKTESFSRSSMASLDEHKSHIDKLLANLEDDNIDKSELNSIKAATDELLDQFAENHGDIIGEMSDVLKSFKEGALTAAQLSNLVSAHYKAEYADRTADVIQKQLDNQFEMMVELIDDVESGAELNKNKLDSMFSGMNLVMDSVNSLSKVMVLPPKKVVTTIKEVESSMEKKSADFQHKREVVDAHVIRSKFRSPAKGGHAAEIGIPVVEQAHGKKKGTDVPTPIRHRGLFDKEKGHESSDEDTSSRARSRRQGPHTHTRVRKSSHASIGELGELEGHAMAVHTYSHGQPVDYIGQARRGSEDTRRHGAGRRRSTSHEAPVIVDDGKGVQISMETYRRLMEASSHQPPLHSVSTQSSSQDNEEKKMPHELDHKKIELAEINRRMEQLVIKEAEMEKRVIEFKAMEAIQRTDMQDQQRDMYIKTGSFATSGMIMSIDDVVEEDHSGSTKGRKPPLRNTQNQRLRRQMTDNSVDENDKVSLDNLLQAEKKEFAPLASNGYKARTPPQSPELRPKRGVSPPQRTSSPAQSHRIAPIRLGSPHTNSLTPTHSIKVSPSNKDTFEAPVSPVHIEQSVVIHEDIHGVYGDPVVASTRTEEKNSLLAANTFVDKGNLVNNVQNVLSNRVDSLKPADPHYMHPRYKYGAKEVLSPPPRSSARELFVVAGPRKVDKATETEFAVIVETAKPSEPVTDELVSPLRGNQDRKDKGLPIVFKEGALTTRTYRHQTTKSIEEELLETPNPVMYFYRNFKELISNEHRSQLLRAAAVGELHENDVSNKIDGIFQPIVVETTNLENQCLNCIREMTVCEDIVKTFAGLLLKETKLSFADKEILKTSLEQIHRRVGQAVFLDMHMNIQLLEYRSIFESMQMHSRHTFNLMISHQGNKHVHTAYDALLSCQGRMSELAAMVVNIKGLCERCHVPLKGSNGFVLGDGSEIKQLLVKKPPTKNSNGEEFNIASAENDDGSSLRVSLAIANKNLDDANDEIEDLSVELFKLSQQKDLTPGSLLFYSALYDPNIVVTVQQLLQQLVSLRKFADCSEHFDFQLLRRRLQVCIGAVPPLEKFINKYSTMHKQWTKMRYSAFQTRHQVGGDADGAFVCPMCALDGRGKAKGDTINKQKQQQKESKGRTGTALIKNKYERTEPKKADSALNMNGLTVSTSFSVTSPLGRDGLSGLTPALQSGGTHPLMRDYVSKRLSQSLPHL